MRDRSVTPVRDVVSEPSKCRSGFQVNDRHGAARIEHATVRRFIEFAKRSARSTRSNVERERLQKLRTGRIVECEQLAASVDLVRVRTRGTIDLRACIFSNTVLDKIQRAP